MIEYLKGYVAGMNTLCQYSNGGIFIDLYSLSNDGDILEVVRKKLSDCGWMEEEIPTELKDISRGSLKSYIRRIIIDAIPACDAEKVTVGLITVLTNEYGGQFDVVGHVFPKDLDGQSLVFVVQTKTERVLFSFGVSYD